MDKIIGILLVVSAIVTLYFSFFNSAKIFIG
jgi:sugar phosphate permease